MEKVKKLTKKQLDLEILKQLNKLNSNVIKKKDIKDIKNSNTIKDIIVYFILLVGVITVVLGLGLIYSWNNYLIVGFWILTLGVFIGFQE